MFVSEARIRKVGVSYHVFIPRMVFLPSKRPSSLDMGDGLEDAFIKEN